MWIKRWNDLIWHTPTKPGVWRRKAGGFRIRGRAKNPRTGKLDEINRALADELDPGRALRTLLEEQAKIKGAAEVAAAPPAISLRDYGLALIERKRAAGELTSPASYAAYRDVLKLHLHELGDLLVGQIHRRDLETWKAHYGQEIAAGRSPNSCNFFLAVIKVVVDAYVAEFELDRSPMLGVKRFSRGAYRTYTVEEPNALGTRAEARRFTDRFLALYPQYFAFLMLGLFTGLRPSSMRPLRRRGPRADLRLDEGVLYIRRSQTKGEPIDTTKSGYDQRLTLPPFVLAILRWHMGQLEGAQLGSELLFPNRTGGFLSHCVLVEPLRRTAAALGLDRHLSARCLRRTYHDMMREQGTDPATVRAISGHHSDEMRQIYSTVGGPEMARELARMSTALGPAARRLLLASGDQSGDSGPAAEADSSDLQ
jgi:integrase